MSDQVRPGYVRSRSRQTMSSNDKIMSGQHRSCQVRTRSVQSKSGPVRTCHAKIKSGQVMSRVIQIRLDYVRLVKSCQVRSMFCQIKVM